MGGSRASADGSLSEIDNWWVLKLKYKYKYKYKRLEVYPKPNWELQQTNFKVVSKENYQAHSLWRFANWLFDSFNLSFFQSLTLLLFCNVTFSHSLPFTILHYLTLSHFHTFTHSSFHRPTKLKTLVTKPDIFWRTWRSRCNNQPWCIQAFP